MRFTSILLPGSVLEGDGKPGTYQMLLPVRVYADQTVTPAAILVQIHDGCPLEPAADDAKPAEVKYNGTVSEIAEQLQTKRKPAPDPVFLRTLADATFSGIPRLIPEASTKEGRKERLARLKYEHSRRTP